MAQMAPECWFPEGSEGPDRRVLRVRSSVFLGGICIGPMTESGITAPDGPRVAQEGSRDPERAPRKPQDGPKMAQDGTKMGPKTPQEADIRAQDGPR